MFVSALLIENLVVMQLQIVFLTTNSYLIKLLEYVAFQYSESLSEDSSVKNIDLGYIGNKPKVIIVTTELIMTYL